MDTVEVEVMDYDLQAQEAAEAHLQQCWAYLDDQYEAEEPDMAGPFCGCTTCEVREILHAAYPFLKELVLQEQRWGPSAR